ncbi:hydroxyectoine utilization dehydratase EutB [Rhodobacter sp. NSM]|uniref:hydroxyectoine utilization dehydratase EutB n=1 Tax=Rhodobacter sp. NSM TaxID=3457501 RepID=UPI003FD37D41
MGNALDLSAVLEAARVIAGRVVRTPLAASPALSDRTGVPVWMKLETLQPTGAFKLRGATNALASLSPDEAARGVVCCSTGNHGRAIAHAARGMGIPATVCLSSLVPAGKVAAVEALGARVIRKGASQDEAQAEADRLVAAEGLSDIPPFDHPAVIAGQGTIGLEMLVERPEIETLLVPLSGGGLIAGVALAARTLKPAIRIVGISMERGAAMAASLAAGRPVDVEELSTLADSLGGGIGLGNLHTFRLVRDLVDEVVLLTEQEISTGMRWMLMRERLVTEGAAAVGAAAILAGKVTPSGPTAIVVSGQNVDMAQLLALARGEQVTLGDVTVKAEAE